MYLYTSNNDWLVYRKDKNYYPKVLLEKCIFIIIETKMSNFNDCYKLDSDDFDEENSDEYINLFLEKTI